MNNELFGGVFYINLEHRQDRKEEIENEIQKLTSILSKEKERNIELEQEHEEIKRIFEEVI